MATYEVAALMGHLESLHGRIADFEEVTARIQDQLRRLSESVSQKATKSDVSQEVYSLKERLNHMEGEVSQSQLDTACLQSKVSMFRSHAAERDALREEVRDINSALDGMATAKQLSEMRTAMEALFSIVVQIDECGGAKAQRSIEHAAGALRLEAAETAISTLQGAHGLVDIGADVCTGRDGQGRSEAPRRQALEDCTIGGTMQRCSHTETFMKSAMAKRCEITGTDIPKASALLSAGHDHANTVLHQTGGA